MSEMDGVCAIVPEGQNGFRPHVIGMGILVGDREVITCAHVVSFVLGLTTPELKPKETVRVCFPFDPGAVCVNGVVDPARWFPPKIAADGAVTDVAVIQLDADAPTGVGRAILEEHIVGASAQVYGFRTKEAEGRDRVSHTYGEWAKGEIAGPQPDGRAQFDGGTSGASIEKGYSGGGVYDPIRAAVVGMIVQTDRDRAVRIAQFIDKETLWKALGVPAKRAATSRALEAYARAERRQLLNRLVRFRSPRLVAAEGQLEVDVAAVLEAMHVPFRVQTRVGLPGDEQEALMGEQARSRDQDHLWHQRGGAHLAPPSSEERLLEQERKSIRLFDEMFVQWQKNWRLGSPPVVVLGDPGYGKTWLSSVLSARLLRDYVATDAGSSRGRWLPLRLTCKELGVALQKPSLPLPETVAAIVRDRATTEGADEETRQDLYQLVCQRMRQMDALLVLDGWDEFSGSQEDLRDKLAAWGGPMVVTSRVIGRPRTLQAKDDPWQLLAVAIEDVPALIRGWCGPGDPSLADALLKALQSRPRLRQLVRVPLLCSLVCWMWSREKVPPLPEQRTKLIQECLGELLRAGREQEHSGKSAIRTESVDDILEDVLLAVAQLAYETFTSQRWIISKMRLQEVMDSLPRYLRQGSGLDYYKILTGRFGLFTDAGKDGVEILHQTFAEFLCAFYVCKEYGKDLEKFPKWLSEHAGVRLLDPRWHEVWCHLAALLPGPSADEFVRELGAICLRRKPGVDRLRRAAEDTLGTASCLALTCLASAGNLKRVEQWVQVPGIQAAIRSAEERFLAESDQGSLHALVALGQTGYLSSLHRMVADPDPEVRKKCIHLSVLIGTTAVHHILLPLLVDRDKEVRCGAASFLGVLGPAGEQGIPRLVEQLIDSDADVRAEAAWALGRMGRAGSQAIPRLVERLADSDPGVRDEAATAIAVLGPAPDEALVAHLMERLNDPDQDVRTSVAAALGAAGVNPIPRLLDQLDDANVGVRVAAAKAIAALAPYRTHIFPRLPNDKKLLLTIKREGIRRNYAESVGFRYRRSSDLLRLTESSRPIGAEAVSRLINLLDDPDVTVRAEAAKALGSLGPAAAQAFDRLTERLVDSDADVRGWAARALGLLGPAGVPAVSRLVERLSDSNPLVRLEAADALQLLDPEAAEAIYANQLSDPDRWVRIAARGRLESLGSEGAMAVGRAMALVNPKDQLAEPGAELWEEAALFLGGQTWRGVPAIPRLLPRMEDRNARGRSEAAEALESLLPNAVFMFSYFTIRKVENNVPEFDSFIQSVMESIGPASVRSVPLLRKLLDDRHSRVRGSAARILGNLARITRASEFRNAVRLTDSEEEVRASAARVLANLEPALARAMPRLFYLLGDDLESDAALQALVDFGPRAFGPRKNLIRRLTGRLTGRYGSMRRLVRRRLFRRLPKWLGWTLPPLALYFASLVLCSATSMIKDFTIRLTANLLLGLPLWGFGLFFLLRRFERAPPEQASKQARTVLNSWSSELRATIFADGTIQRWKDGPLSDLLT